MITIVVHESVYDEIVEKIEEKTNAVFVKDEAFHADSISLTLAAYTGIFRVNYADYINNPTDYRIHIKPSSDICAVSPEACIEFLMNKYDFMRDNFEQKEVSSSKVNLLDYRVGVLEASSKSDTQNFSSIFERLDGLADAVNRLDEMARVVERLDNQAYFRQNINMNRGKW